MFHPTLTGIVGGVGGVSLPDAPPTNAGIAIFSDWKSLDLTQ